MNLLEPWVLVRLAASLVAVVLFFRASWVATRVLRKFDLSRATEGQLALEKQVDLASTFVRIATTVQVVSLALTVLVADRLSHGVRGAMCAYGVFNANEWGFRALACTGSVALVAGVVSQFYAFDARIRTLEMVRPTAIATLLMFPLAVVDLVVSFQFLTKLDLSVAASCCSVELDSVSAGNGGFATGPRVLATTIAVATVSVAVVVSALAARKPRRGPVFLAGALSLVALPFALAASVLEVAPHAFEIPQHVCPFCLLRADVWAMGYPLFGSIFLAVVWAVGGAVAAVFAGRSGVAGAFEPFARERMRRGAFAWIVALAVGLVPVLHYTWSAGGASLFSSH
ncbi:MAG: hypothetical protein U0169_16865 [Polyangiaceae bacterium]